MRGSLSIVQFLCSAGASRFSAPASFFEGVARRGGQDWPQATAAGGLVLTITSTPPCWVLWGRSLFELLQRGRLAVVLYRAPGASTYIRQLRDGLPQSCVHKHRQPRRRVHTFCRRERRQSYSRLPVAPPGSEGGPKLNRSCRGHIAPALWRGSGHNDALGDETGFHIAPERDGQFSGERH